MTFVLAIITAAIFLAADQITKLIVMKNMTLGQSIDFINGFLDFTYIHNDGGAWGLFGGGRWFLIGLTAAIMVLLIVLLIKNKGKSKLFFWAGCLIISGGIGNMIDRIFRGGMVVDFLHATFINFPIFNVADCAVVIGAGLLILYYMLDIKNDLKKGKE